MKTKSLFLPGVTGSTLLACASALSAASIEKLQNPTPDATHQLVWQTEVGTSYSVESSNNLVAWNLLDGYPVQASGSTLSLPLKLDQGRLFFRVITHAPDVPQPPEGFAYVPPGTFLMGSPESELGRHSGEVQHTVTLTLGFHMKKTEVSYNEWLSIRSQAAGLGYTDLRPGTNGFNGDASGTHPVTQVTWWDAIKWCNLRSEIEGRTPVYYTAPERTLTSTLRTGSPTTLYLNWNADGYRLPTEAEWEYACRAGTSTAFYTGDLTRPGIEPVDPALDLAGWYYGNAITSRPVAGKMANSFGLYDTHGNVSEWCWDWGSNYAGDATDPRGPTSQPPNAGRIIRGGNSFNPAEACRSAARAGYGPNEHSLNIGFRPVVSVAP